MNYTVYKACQKRLFVNAFVQYYLQCFRDHAPKTYTRVKPELFTLADKVHTAIHSDDWTEEQFFNDETFAFLGTHGYAKNTPNKRKISKTLAECQTFKSLYNAIDVILENHHTTGQLKFTDSVEESMATLGALPKQLLDFVQKSAYADELENREKYGYLYDSSEPGAVPKAYITNNLPRLKDELLNLWMTKKIPCDFIYNAGEVKDKMFRLLIKNHLSSNTYRIYGSVESFRELMKNTTFTVNPMTLI